MVRRGARVALTRAIKVVDCLRLGVFLPEKRVVLPNYPTHMTVGDFLSVLFLLLFPVMCMGMATDGRRSKLFHLDTQVRCIGLGWVRSGICTVDVAHPTLKAVQFVV